MSEAERDLLRAVGRGEPGAFDALVHATAPQVWGLARRLTADDAIAEDVLQEVYLGVWRGAAAYTGEGSARGWLYALTRRQAARSWRRRAGQPAFNDAFDEQLAHEDAPSDPAPLGQLAGWGTNPELAASRAEDRQQLLEAIATLAPPDQRVLTLCDLEGQSPSEAAAALDLTPGAARVRLHRARLRLMAALRHGSDHD